MKITPEGLDLIRQHEGLRLKAYRDPVGVWTIGYGHTGAAGKPDVSAGLRITKEDAEKFLRRDVEGCVREIASVIRRPLNAQQFSALVSFCYNIGSSNFRKSSVLAAVNAGDLDAVPRRLALWTKAGGRVLPGLVRRRADEAALFVGNMSTSEGPADQPVLGKPARRSTTILAAICAAILSALQAVLGDAGPILTVLLVFGIFAAVIWIIAERVSKSKKDGV